MHTHQQKANIFQQVVLYNTLVPVVQTFPPQFVGVSKILGGGNHLAVGSFHRDFLETPEICDSW